MTDLFDIEMWKEFFSFIESFLELVLLAISIIASIWGAITTYILASYRAYTKVYFPKDATDFLNYFAKVIRKAKEEILITGEGFNLDDDISRHNSEILDSAIIDALEKGISIKRIQLIERMPISYLSRLYEIKTKYKHNFRVFVNRKLQSIGNKCVIDPDRRQTVYESQDTSDLVQGYGGQPKDWIFVHGHRKKSKNLANEFNKILLDSSTQELSLDDIQNLHSSLWYERLNNKKLDEDYVLIDRDMIDLLINNKSIENSYDPNAFQRQIYRMIDA